MATAGTLVFDPCLSEQADDRALHSCLPLQARPTHMRRNLTRWRPHHDASTASQYLWKKSALRRSPCVLSAVPVAYGPFH